MVEIFHTRAFELGATVVIGSVWIVFGLYCKVLDQVPRHRRIVERVLGAQWGWLILVIGVGETMLGLWVFTGWERVVCAAVMTAAILGMNALEIWLAKELLFSPAGMVVLNVGLVALIWAWALK